MPSVQPPIVDQSVHTSPLGPLYSVWTPDGLWQLNWQPREEAQGAADRPGTDEAKRLDEALQSYFTDGDSGPLDAIVIDPAGWTPFLASVYAACRAIPCGQTVTYGELAAAAGRAKAMRAVGSAMARNRVPVIIPCHRVVSRSGLRGYSAPGGLDTKQWLLALERDGYRERVAAASATRIGSAAASTSTSSPVPHTRRRTMSPR
ncbi:methylated-DNA--[protein]-cysteine S-methyltransferase [Roseimaritima sediminicola]|uniref:methylated-DNA--[protein]-cysteine S-methyltransferase n=1 Tax=Roseimaritima sediminicola TaxID=2662066 RepID=UPI001298362E|nr:methylated-DNA--[protein]-cysteine S-methyltransferase [Roseimaritima sediminicola]